jgi:hypothetical protein
MMNESLLRGSRRRAALLLAVALSTSALVEKAVARPLQAQACGQQDRDLCARQDSRCLRDCADLTTCSRHCCEGLHECLAAKGCEILAPACAR